MKLINDIIDVIAYSISEYKNTNDKVFKSRQILKIITSHRLRMRPKNTLMKLYFTRKIEVLELILRIVRHTLDREKKRSAFTFVKLFLSKNEEWRGFISEQKYEWAKSGLTEDQIKRKEIIFFIGFFWGEFKIQLQSLRVLSWIKLIYK